MENNNKAPVLVIGATGLLGSEICHQLIEKGREVRGLVRTTSDPGKIAVLRNIGVKTVTGDLKNRASLDAACRGVQAVIATASSTLSRQEGDSIQTVDLEGQLNAVEAAEAAGVSQFVFISFPELPVKNPLREAKSTVENRLQSSKMSYTILQASVFMEVWISPVIGFDYPNSQATVYGEGKNKISWISLKDVAQFAVAALNTPAAANTTIHLGGPDALSPLEVIRLFEEHTSSQFRVNCIPKEALQAQYDNAVDPIQKSFAALMLSCAAGQEVDMKATLRQFPFILTSVKEYVQQVLPVKSAIV